MTFIDILFLFLLIYFVFQGFKKGVIMELTTMVAIIIAMIASLKLTYVTLEWFGLKGKSAWIPYFTYIIVFVCFYILIYVVGKQLHNLINTLNLNIFNRIAGAALGACKIILIFSFLIWLTQQIDVIPANLKGKSITYRYMKDVAPAVISFVSSWIPSLRDIISQIENFFDQISRSVSK
jgi:membrane protein required for colicin V production